MGELEAGLSKAARISRSPPHRLPGIGRRMAWLAENVEAGGKAADIGMDSFQLRQDALGPGLPRGFEEPAAAFRRFDLAQGAVVGEYGARQAAADELVGGDDVTRPAPS